VVGIATPAIFILGVVSAAKTGSWWLIPLAAFILLATWSAIPQRLDIEHGTVYFYFLPFRHWAITLPLSEARFTCDGIWLNVARLDGLRIGRHRKSVGIRATEISGPSAVVHDMRAQGVHVERTPKRFW
jgi:hypothetical protein